MAPLFISDVRRMMCDACEPALLGTSTPSTVGGWNSPFLKDHRRQFRLSASAALLSTKPEKSTRMRLWLVARARESLTGLVRSATGERAKLSSGPEDMKHVGVVDLTWRNQRCEML